MSGLVPASGFEQPALLLLLAPASAAAALIWERSKRRFEEVAAALGPPRGWSRLGDALALARAAALLLLVVAAAQPYVEYRVPRKITVAEEGLLRARPVVMVVLLDVSKSMGYPMGAGSRMDAAKHVLHSFLVGLDGNATVHLVFFSGNVTPVYTGDARGAAKVLDEARGVEKYTAIGDALAYAIGFLRASSLPGAVLLVSDGGQNYGSDPVTVAAAYRSLHIPLVVLAVDGPGVLPQVASAAGAKMYKVDEYSMPAASSLGDVLWREARLEALQARGEAVVWIVRKSHAPTAVLALLAAILAAMSLLEGV